MSGVCILMRRGPGFKGGGRLTHCAEGEQRMERKGKMRAVVACVGGCERKSDGTRACRYGCLACGACAAACPRGAIRILRTGRGEAAQSDRTRCIGCGQCVSACPQHLIRLVPAENRIQVICSNRDPGREARTECPNSCIGCGRCERVCSSGAIRLEGALAVIREEKCIACGMCAVSCPRSVIHDADGLLSDPW